MRFYLLLFALVVSSVSSYCQILEPVKWTSETKHIGGNEFEIIFHAQLDDEWATYSQTSDPDGPIPTSVNFDADSHFETVGSAKEKGKKKEGPEPLFDNVVVGKYYHKVDFIQRIKVLDYSKPVTGYVNYMACDSEKCTPPTDYDFEFTFQSHAEQESAAIDREVPQGGAQSIKEEPKTGIDNTELTENTETDIIEAEGENILSPIKWTFGHEKISDGKYALNINAKIDAGWYIYSQFIEEGGPVPTGFFFTEGEHYAVEGGVEEISDYRVAGFDPIFEMDVIKFKKSITFRQNVIVEDVTAPIEGSLEFMVCDDTRCLPPEFVDFSFDLTGESGQIIPTSGFGANMVGNIIDQEIPTIRETYLSPLGNCGAEDVARGNNYLLTFFLGFAGGLIALLTPCVFPMIPLTVSFFTKDTRRKGWVNAPSIVVIYVTIGLVITGVFGATALNELSTNALANTLFFIIFVAFAFSFFGYYEITLPSSWANKSDTMADKGGLIGIFFMAFTLAIVSFSCTGPIIGSAIVQSATSALGPFIVMFGFSMALAIPFGLFAAFPAFLNTLPKSGSWMNSVKVVLGFLELALALKFLSVADMTKHWGFLKYELFMGAWVLIFFATTLYLFGFIKFPHDSPIKKLSPTRWVFGLSFAALTFYLATGFTFNEKTQSYDSLKLMSGLAPPAQYNFFLPEPELDMEIKKNYPSFSKCANNLDCFKDYYEGLAYAKTVNKPVLLDFTGYGCVNCRKTEEHIWVRDEVWNRIAEDYVLVSLYVDDRKPLKEILLSKTRSTKLRNVGNKWADFQIVNFEQNSQPLYVMMTPNEEIIAKPRGYKEGVKDYADFLDCGLKVYESIE
jgi:thiol:disulfide interchange protein DsbD